MFVSLHCSFWLSGYTQLGLVLLGCWTRPAGQDPWQVEQLQLRGRAMAHELSRNGTCLEVNIRSKLHEAIY